MPSTILDSAVFRDIFTTPAMRGVWSDENRVQKYLDFEAALGARARQARHHSQERRRRNRPPLRRPARSTWRSSRKRPRRSAIRCFRWCSSSSSYARTGSANGHTGAPPPRTSPTPPPSCRSARRSISSKKKSTASPTRSPSSPRNTATRRWPGAATCNRRCLSPSATRWRLCSAPSSATSSASRNCARACWWANSAAPPARCPRSARMGSRYRPS